MLISWKSSCRVASWSSSRIKALRSVSWAKDLVLPREVEQVVNDDLHHVASRTIMSRSARCWVFSSGVSLRRMSA